MLSKFKLCAKGLKWAHEALQATTEEAAAAPSDEDEAGEAGGEATHMGRKSVAVFLSHRREELKREAARVAAFTIERQRQGKATGAKLGEYFLRTFLWESASDAPPEQVADQLTATLRASFGLGHYEKACKQDEGVMMEAFRSNVPGGVVSFRRLFGGNYGKEQVKPRPVKIEVCSGTGEWIVAQVASPPKGDIEGVESRVICPYMVINHSLSHRWLAHPKGNPPTRTHALPSPSPLPALTRLAETPMLIGSRLSGAVIEFTTPSRGAISTPFERHLNAN